MMAGTHRAELDAGHSPVEEHGRVGGAVSTHRLGRAGRMRPPPAAARRRDCIAGLEIGRCDEVDALDRDPQPTHLSHDLVGILPGQEPDIEIDAAPVGHPVDGIAAADAAEVHRRARRKERRSLLRERQLRDAPGDLDGLQHSVLTQPRRRAVGRTAAHVQPQNQRSLGLDADVQIGGLAAHHELPDVAGVREPGGGLVVVRRASDSSSGTIRSCDAHSARPSRESRPSRPARPASPPARPSCRSCRGRTGDRPAREP